MAAARRYRGCSNRARAASLTSRPSPPRVNLRPTRRRRAGQRADPSIAMEYSGRGIRINAVAPGGTEAPARLTPRNHETPTAQEQAWYQQVVAQTVESSLMHRYGTLAEQANAILFLASDEAAISPALRCRWPVATSANVGWRTSRAGSRRKPCRRPARMARRGRAEQHRRQRRREHRGKVRGGRQQADVTVENPHVPAA